MTSLNVRLVFSIRRNYGWKVPENVPLKPWHEGVLELQDPVPVNVPFETLPLPVNSTKLPLASPATNITLNAPLAGTGLAATPSKTPCPVFFDVLGSPVPEIEPCPVLLLAMKQTGPCTENIPTGVITLQGLETNDTW
jgi:hypothetical protein